MAKKFPKKLYVKIEVDSAKNGYFVADDAKYGLAEAGERIKIATYELVTVEQAEMVLKTTA